MVAVQSPNLLYCTVTVGKCFSYFGSFVLPGERIFPMCFAPEVICCFSMYAHKQLLPLCLNIESAVPCDEAITKACHVYLHRSAASQSSNALNSQTLCAGHRAVGHQWPSASPFLIGSGLGLPAWLCCAPRAHLKNGHSFIFPPCLEVFWRQMCWRMRPAWVFRCVVEDWGVYFVFILNI